MNNPFKMSFSSRWTCLFCRCFVWCAVTSDSNWLISVGKKDVSVSPVIQLWWTVSVGGDSAYELSHISYTVTMMLFHQGCFARTRRRSGFQIISFLSLRVEVPTALPFTGVCPTQRGPSSLRQYDRTCFCFFACLFYSIYILVI